MADLKITTAWGKKVGWDTDELWDPDNVRYVLD